ncbi:hypothetical protein Acr_05g0016640 [Actinidia rufa]|uniref:Uncharacterized protein n=1 Tax=Actinidia rufa TaxID=165716 RepID=A0A7J0ENE7_9ERIC|nr:hypothetical protein Acr_05g0016640 [Actinidia rufa]
MCSSFRLGKKVQCPNKVSKSFAKLSKAMTKTSHCIATLLSSNRSLSQKQRFPNASYSSLTNLYECPCSYHHRKRMEFHGLEEDIPKERGHVVRDDKSESDKDTEKVDEESINGMDEKGKDWMSLFEVNERAERFIESLREDQKLQRQRSI